MVQTLGFLKSRAQQVLIKLIFSSRNHHSSNIRRPHRQASIQYTYTVHHKVTPHNFQPHTPLTPINRQIPPLQVPKNPEVSPRLSRATSNPHQGRHQGPSISFTIPNANFSTS